MRHILLVIFIVLPLFAESQFSGTKWGKTRLGFEVTEISDYDMHAYNFKFEQKAMLYGVDINFQAYKREYTMTPDNSEAEHFGKVNIWPTIKFPVYLYYEGFYDFHISGDKDHNEYIHVYGVWYKFNKYIETRVAYATFDDSRSDRTKKAFHLMFKGDFFKIKKHYLGYETYYFNFYDRQGDDASYKASLEVKYKYRVVEDIDLYAYSVNGWKPGLYKTRLDIGIYWYF